MRRAVGLLLPVLERSGQKQGAEVLNFDRLIQFFLEFELKLEICLSFLASLWLRAVVVGGVGRVGRAALVAHYRLRAHDVSKIDYVG